MKQVEELRRNAEEGKDRIRQARITVHKPGWDFLVDYVRDSDPASGNLAVAQAPFFSEVKLCKAFSHLTVRMWTRCGMHSIPKPLS